MPSKRSAPCAWKTGIDPSVSGGPATAASWREKVKSNSSHLREKNEAPEDRNGRVPRKYGKRTAGKAIQPKQRPLAYACRGNIDRSRLPGDWLRLSPASAGWPTEWTAGTDERHGCPVARANRDGDGKAE